MVAFPTASVTERTAAGAADSTGIYGYPVEIDGKAIEAQPRPSATRIAEA